MANKRILVKRRKSVRNIRKITRTMQLIATARFQAAFTRATATKPYSEKLAELVSALSGAAEGLSHPLLETPTETQRSALVVITSDRGLCGGYNSNILKTSLSYIDSHECDGSGPDVHMVGRKGHSYFRFLDRPIAQHITNIGDRPRFEDVEVLGNELMRQFTQGEIAGVHVSYMQFISTGKQQASIMQLLPLGRELLTGDGASHGTSNVDFEFSPAPAELLGELLPASVRLRLFQCFTDAAVSEQISRMVAMKAATDAAEEMITTLTRQYNRARQTQITMELLDIIGGVNALA